MCGGTKPCNILRWESQTFHKKTIFQFQSLEWKVWDTGFKSLKKSDVNLKSKNGKIKDEQIEVLQKKPQYRISEWKKEIKILKILK